MSDPRPRTRPWQVIVTIAVVLALTVGGALALGNFAATTCWAPCLPLDAGENP